MKTLHIGVFDPSLICQASPYCGDNVFARGFEKLNHDVNRFDYRATAEPNKALLNVAEQLKPDLFWFGKCERINSETISILKNKYKNSIFCKWAADVRENPTIFDLEHLKYMDLFAATYAGDYLLKHKKVMPKDSKAVSILTFTDSDFYKWHSFPDKYKSDILWTGRQGFGDNLLRNEIIKKLNNLKEEVNIAMYTPENWLGYPEYLHAICGTKIGIGSNSFNRRKYSSDRLGNYMSCGTFYMTQNIEGLNECFTKGEDIEWFDTIDEMEEKIFYYLENYNLAKEIAKKGQKIIHRYFDSEPLVSNLLQVLETGKSRYKWDEIY